MIGIAANPDDLIVRGVDQYAATDATVGTGRFNGGRHDGRLRGDRQRGCRVGGADCIALDQC